MTLVAEPEAVDLQEPRSWRRTKNRLATVLMVLSIIVVMLPLGWVIYAVIDRGASIISWKFLTEPDPARGGAGQHGGHGPGCARHVVDHRLGHLDGRAARDPRGDLHQRVRRPGSDRGLVRFMADVMTGVPSIVMGLFIFSIWTLHFGFSGFAGALALACLMLPIVIRSSEEMLKLVPNSLREASYAVGPPRPA